MAALNFPASPVVNQTHEAAGKKWRWDGRAWVSGSSALGSMGLQHADDVAISGGAIGGTEIEGGGY